MGTQTHLAPRTMAHDRKHGPNQQWHQRAQLGRVQKRERERRKVPVQQATTRMAVVMRLHKYKTRWTASHSKHLPSGCVQTHGHGDGHTATRSRRSLCHLQTSATRQNLARTWVRRRQYFLVNGCGMSNTLGACKHTTRSRRWRQSSSFTSTV